MFHPKITLKPKVLYIVGKLIQFMKKLASKKYSFKTFVTKLFCLKKKNYKRNHQIILGVKTVYMAQKDLWSLPEYPPNIFSV